MLEFDAQVTCCGVREEEVIVLLASGDVYCVDRECRKMYLGRVQCPLANPIITEKKLITVCKSSVYQTDLETLTTESRTMAFKGKPQDWFSDHLSQHFLALGEVITKTEITVAKEACYYIAGTSTGKLLVSRTDSLDVQIYLHHKAAITCLYATNERLISCCKEHLLCLWDITNIKKESQERFRPSKKSSKIERSLTERELKGVSVTKKTIPLKLFCLSGSPITRILQTKHLPKQEDLLDQDLFENSLRNWGDTLIGQCEDKSIILISPRNNNIICCFQLVSSVVTDTYIHVLLEYLIVACEDGRVFIYNLMSQTLERVISQAEAQAYGIHSNKALGELNSCGDAQHEIIEYNTRKHNYPSESLISIKHLTIFGNEFPVLILDSTHAPKASLDMLYYCISLSSCALQDCAAYTHVKECLNMIHPYRENLIAAIPGTIGLGQAFSFPFPVQKTSHQLSKYISASLLCSELAIFSYVTGSRGKKEYSKRHNKSYLTPASHNSNKLKHPDISYLALQALTGALPARKCLSATFVYMSHSEKEKVYQETIVLLGQFQHPAPELAEPTPVSPIEAQVCIILGYLSIETRQSSYQFCEKLLASLLSLLNSGVPGYITTSSDILSKGVELWKPILTQEQLQFIVRRLLTYGYSSLAGIPAKCHKSLVNIACGAIKTVFGLVMAELPMYSVHRKHPLSCLSFVHIFATKKYEESSLCLPAIVDIIISSLDPHSPELRKICITQATKTLQMLITHYPNIDFNQTKQRLAIGTVTGVIVVYDLKVACRWRTLEDHSGQVLALGFNAEGNVIVSYSQEDLTLRVWKLGATFLTEIFQGHYLRSSSVINLPSVGDLGGSYKNHLRTARVLCSANNRTVLLTREDGKHYNFVI